MNRDSKAASATADDSAVDLTAPSTSTFAPTLTSPSLVVPAPRAARLVPSAWLGQYQLIRELGSGGMGIVFEAEDEWLHRRVALKVLRTDLPAQEVARERFLREARAMAAIESEHVVTVFNVGEASGRPYMAMQLLDGESLETHLERAPRLPVPEAARIGREIALGLSTAHAKGILHRDVKPGNVWLESTGRVKLLDFGLALARDGSHLTQTGFIIGTPAFMAPEQARSEPLDARSDLFGLGVILYVALTGEQPFAGPDTLAVMRSLELHYPARVNVRRPDVPAAFSNLVMELLAKERKDRPASSAAVADRLGRSEITHLTHLPIAPPAVPEPPAPVVPYNPLLPARPADPGAVASFVRTLFLLAAVAVAVYAFWHFHVTNYGQLAIDTDIADAEVQIRQNGHLKQTSVKDRRFELRPGTYELVLQKPREGYKLNRTVVEVRRRGQETVRVMRDSSQR